MPVLEKAHESGLAPGSHPGTGVYSTPHHLTGGEGSRGGKVIGHTRSGKAVYERGRSYGPGWTKQDHADAFNHHKRAAAQSGPNQRRHQEIADHHLHLIRRKAYEGEWSDRSEYARRKGASGGVSVAEDHHGALSESDDRAGAVTQLEKGMRIGIDVVRLAALLKAAEQLSLFGASRPVQVRAHTRHTKHGAVFVDPHTRHVHHATHAEQQAARARATAYMPRLDPSMVKVVPSPVQQTADELPGLNDPHPEDEPGGSARAVVGFYDSMASNKMTGVQFGPRRVDSRRAIGDKQRMEAEHEAAGRHPLSHIAYVEKAPMPTAAGQQTHTWTVGDGGPIREGDYRRNPAMPLGWEMVETAEEPTRAGVAPNGRTTFNQNYTVSPVTDPDDARLAAKAEAKRAGTWKPGMFESPAAAPQAPPAPTAPPLNRLPERLPEIPSPLPDRGEVARIEPFNFGPFGPVSVSVRVKEGRRGMHEADRLAVAVHWTDSNGVAQRGVFDPAEGGGWSGETPPSLVQWGLRALGVPLRKPRKGSADEINPRDGSPNDFIPFSYLDRGLGKIDPNLLMHFEGWADHNEAMANQDAKIRASGPGKWNPILDLYAHPQSESRPQLKRWLDRYARTGDDAKRLLDARDYAAEAGIRPDAYDEIARRLNMEPIPGAGELPVPQPGSTHTVHGPRGSAKIRGTSDGRFDVTFGAMDKDWNGNPEFRVSHGYPSKQYKTVKAAHKAIGKFISGES